MSELEKKCEAQSAELQKLLEKGKELQQHLDAEQNLRRQDQQVNRTSIELNLYQF